MTQAMQNVLLDLNDVARELGVGLIPVFRIIARGALKAARVGRPGSDHSMHIVTDATLRALGQGWRVTNEALSDYISAGAPDLQMPPAEFSPQHTRQPATSGWIFDPVLARDTELLVSALERIGSEQVPDVPKLQDDLDAARRFNPRFHLADMDKFFGDRTLKVTDGVRSVLNAPAPSGGPFANWLEAAATHWLREETAAQFRETHGGLAGLAYFYDPAEYENHANDGWLQLVKGERVRVSLRREVEGRHLFFKLTARDLLGTSGSAASARFKMLAF